SAVSYAGFGPEHTKERRPALITLALPETGAASRSIPRCASSARNSAEPSREIDEHSTISLGCAAPSPESSPPDPAITSRTSSYVDTMTNTMSHAASSLRRSAMCAPFCPSGSAFARVRFHTVRLAPRIVRRSAIACPMRPVPIQPRRAEVAGVMRIFRTACRWRTAHEGYRDCVRAWSRSSRSIRIGDRQFLRRVQRNDSGSVRRQDHFLLDACGGDAVGGGTICLDREHHPGLQLDRILE